MRPYCVGAFLSMYVPDSNKQLFYMKMLVKTINLPSDTVLDISGIMLGKLLGLSGSASFYFLGWNTCPNLMCRNFGAMGNYSTCSNDGPFADICLIQYGGIHTDKCAFSNCGSVNDGTMSHRHIILQNARHRTSLMNACAILHIHSVSTSDSIYVRAQNRTIPDAAVIAKNTIAG